MCRTLLRTGAGFAFRLANLRAPWKLQSYTTRPKGSNKAALRRMRRLESLSEDPNASILDSDDDPISAETYAAFKELETEAESSDAEASSPEGDPDLSPPPMPSVVPEYRIPHRFIGFNPKGMDLEDFPRFRTDFDGKRSRLVWMGTECQRCGLQIRRERRTNRESSLNVYAHPGIPDDLLRHCPERKSYPVLWRTRDPYQALDILGVEDY